MMETKRANLAITLAILAIIISAITLVVIALKDGSGGGKFVLDDGIQEPDISEFRELQNDDHIRGNPKADIVIVEYSDFECPFCQRDHEVLEQLLASNENIAWVYRHLPLESIHPEAVPAAIASECVAELAGNDAFWTFADEIFAKQDQVGSSLYSNIATDLGIDTESFESCLTSDSIFQKVADDTLEASAIGARGTPFHVIINGKNLTPVEGAIPLDEFQRIINGIQS